MELGKGIWLVTIALIVVLLQSELVSSDGNLQNGSPAAASAATSGVENKKLQEKLNATVSDVIKLMSESSSQQGDQEHGKKSRIYARKGVVMNETIATSTSTTSTPIVAAATVPKASEAQPNSNSTTSSKTTSAVNSSTTSNSSIAVGDTSAAVTNATASVKANSTLPTTLPVKNVTSSVPPPESVSSKPTATTNTSTASTATTSTTTTTSTTATTTTTTTTTSTTTTTTKPPRKPKITYSVDDEPKLIQAAKPGYTGSAGSGGSTQQSDANGRLHIEEPLAELSKEYIPPAMQGPPRGHREYVVPVVTLIFAIPLLMGLFLLSYRRAKEFWLTRHYRRMDFLVDGMYNY